MKYIQWEKTINPAILFILRKNNSHFVQYLLPVSHFVVFFFLFCSKIFSIKKNKTNYLHFQGETDTETYYDTDGDDRGYASLDESAARGKRKEDPGYLSMDELHQPPPKTRKRRKIKNADGKQEVA